MSKREHARLNGSEQLDGSRHKRRREVGESSSDVDISMPEPIEPKAVGAVLSKVEVKQHGLKILQAVKDVVKDGRNLSLAFLRKPPKRQYADYYIIIKEPIAFEDIKKNLDDGTYATLEDVKHDFETLFDNAKKYNLPESQIYMDAKELLKLVHKTYNKLVPSNDEDGEKSKTPNLSRLIKSRLEKLVAKKDTFGRTLSDEFMRLPSKKDWPGYYKVIQKPQCFEVIFKHIKRKEYFSSAAFATDVELVFTNALTFNTEDSQIAQDAVTLRDTFRQLMSDLPPPHSLPTYAKPSNKIKIRPQQVQPVASSSAQHSTKPDLSTPTSLMLRVPAAAAQPTPTAPPPPTAYTLPVAPATAPRPPTTPKAPTPQVQPPPQPPSKAVTPQPPMQAVSFINATPSHYPHVQTAYVPPPPVAPAATATPAIPRASSVVNTQPTVNSPTPLVIYPLSHQLKSITLLIQPKGRYLTMDHRDGVKNWAVRLVPGETSVVVNEVRYMEEDDDEASDDEDLDAEKDEEDEADMDVDVEGGPSSPRNLRKTKARGRGRPPKAATLAAKAAQAAAAAKAAKVAKKKAVPRLGEVQLKLNNFVVKDQPEKAGEWNVYLPVGSNVIEIGEVGGMVWKVYAERMADA